MLSSLTSKMRLTNGLATSTVRSQRILGSSNTCSLQKKKPKQGALKANIFTSAMCVSSRSPSVRASSLAKAAEAPEPAFPARRPDFRRSAFEASVVIGHWHLQKPYSLAEAARLVLLNGLLNACEQLRMWQKPPEVLLSSCSRV